jgi:hypothetical protein
MNILQWPEDAIPGTPMTKCEFEELAIEASLMEDLMDRNDLGPNEFFTIAIERANAKRTYQSTHLWVPNATHSCAVLTKASIVPGLRRLLLVRESALNQAKSLDAAINELIDGGCKP